MDIERKHFYVTYFSNASLDLYPDKNLAGFITHLAHPIHLGTSSEWEVGQCEVSYGGSPKGILVSGMLVDKTIAFVYGNPVTPQFLADKKSPNIANNTLPSERCGTPFSKCLLYPCGEKGFSRYQYTDATNGRFTSPSGSRYSTRKSGTKFSTCGINTRDVTYYRHSRS